MNLKRVAFTFCFLLWAGGANAGEKNWMLETLQSASSSVNSWMKDKGGWLSRVETGAQFGEDVEPDYYIETVQPLRQSSDRVHTLFVQPRYNYNADDGGLFNLGVGYRRYLEHSNALAGVNFFGDYESEDEQGRFGIGAEWLSTPLDLRVNSYIGLTSARQVDSLSGGPVFEKVADGLDFEAGVPLPRVPATKLFGGGQIYFFEETSRELYGWRMRLEIKPIPWSAINVGLRDDNDGPAEWRFDMRVSLDFGGGGSTQPDPSAKPDTRDRALDRVEREHRMIKEKFGEGLSFFVAKA